MLENFCSRISKLDSNHSNPSHAGHLYSIEVNLKVFSQFIQVKFSGFLIMK